MLDVFLDVKLDVHLDVRLDTRLDVSLDARLNVRLDARLDVRLDARRECSVKALTRVNAHLELTLTPKKIDVNAPLFNGLILLNKLLTFCQNFCQFVKNCKILSKLPIDVIHHSFFTEHTFY